MKISAFLLLHIPVLLIAQSPEGFQQTSLKTIAFGSCSHQEKVTDQMWTEVNKEKADLWIWLGDNIYADTEDMSEMWSHYQKQMRHAGYRALMNQTQILGIWDDHDFGVNDGGWEYPMKDESRDLLFDFLQLDKSHPAWERKGAYQAHTFDFNRKRVKILLLDTRYFRESLEWIKEPKAALINKDGHILGEEQWAWLTEQLSDELTDLFIIGSGIQVIPREHRFEKWANFPKARRRLLNLVREKVSAPLIFLSGDRHISEVSKLELNNHPHPLYEVTSSSLTNPWDQRREEKNKYREGRIIYDRNFAVMTLDLEANVFRLKFVGSGNRGLQRFTIRF